MALCKDFTPPGLSPSFVLSLFLNIAKACILLILIFYIPRNYMFSGFNRHVQHRRIWQKTTAGVLKPKHFIGVALILPATVSMFFCVVKRHWENIFAIFPIVILNAPFFPAMTGLAKSDVVPSQD
jgi:hypothetical protein